MRSFLELRSEINLYLYYSVLDDNLSIRSYLQMNLRILGRLFSLLPIFTESDKPKREEFVLKLDSLGFFILEILIYF